MTNEVRSETAVEYQTNPPSPSAATVLKKAFNPETGIEYEIEMPADNVPTEPKTGAEEEPPPEETLFPDEPLAGNYQELRAEIAKELLRQIDEKTVVFVEEMVVYYERSGLPSSLKWDTGVRVRMPRRSGKAVSVEITLSL